MEKLDKNDISKYNKLYDDLIDEMNEIVKKLYTIAKNKKCNDTNDDTDDDTDDTDDMDLLCNELLSRFLEINDDNKPILKDYLGNKITSSTISQLNNKTYVLINYHVRISYDILSSLSYYVVHEIYNDVIIFLDTLENFSRMIQIITRLRKYLDDDI